MLWLTKIAPAEDGLQLALTGLSCAAVLVALILLWTRRARIRETTLVGPWMWLQIALGAATFVQLVKLGGAFSSAATTTAFEFLASAATICPIVSVLGAKRPQHRAWHFVVFSLWIVLVMPAAEVLFIRVGAELRMHAIRRGFLAVLILMGFVNYVPTRFAVPSCCFALGQLLALGPHLYHRDWFTLSFSGGYLLIAMGVILAALSTSTRGDRQDQEWDRAWLEFRDAFGVIWAARVIERLNASGRRLGWMTRLAWSGFQDAQCAAAVEIPDTDESPVKSLHLPSESPQTALEPTIERSFRMLLRRFVSTDWFPPQRNPPDYSESL